MCLILGSNGILKESIVKQIASIVKPSDDIPDIKSISLRNKTEGEINGNWGKFYPIDYRITLCVPNRELITRDPHIRTFTKRNVIFSNHLQWFAAIIGHEYYHAYQWITEPELFCYKEYIEIHAEKYEEVAVKKWNEYIETIKT